MIGILIFFLFMLNIFLILAVVILYQRQNRFIEIERNQRKIQEESEEMLSAFLLELKEENKSFITQFQHSPKNNKQSGDEQLTKIEPEAVVEKEAPITAETYSRLLATEVYKNNQTEVDTKKTFAEQVEDLSQKGLSSSEIAKQLKKGKTEVELLLKFHENRSNT
ncbi:hypothetical protein [Lederbergia panacisoli]|uniref:hypothetical protein n=1 Tax=Lederbergia panacisoli TaxID=1255251 RepID=UPI00214C1FE8|nr:hypothetical protein [Lederbergia panacisoli]MCR2820693.1 hypothetical protein [Lederbergia panacisoli]